MLMVSRRLAPVAVAGMALLLGATAALHSRALRPQSAQNAAAPTSPLKSAAAGSRGASHDDAQALRANTLGVAYMNQQRPADAQKLFEQALQADPNFAVAKVNLGIALLAQQKTGSRARRSCRRAGEQRPDDPYAWYNLGLVYKDLSEQEKGIAAFERVTQLAPNEADAYYFAGYLYTQLQKYDQAIAAFQKALAIFPYHASSEFGLARALQRSGNIAAAKEHLAKFQKITSEHLGAPFYAGPAAIRVAFHTPNSPENKVRTPPAPIPVTYSWESVGAAITQ